MFGTESEEVNSFISEPINFCRQLLGAMRIRRVGGKIWYISITKSKAQKRYIQVTQCRCEKGRKRGAESTVHTITWHTHTHTQLCTTHDTQTNGDKAFRRWVLDGNTEKRGEARTLTGGRGGPASGGEVEVKGGKTTCKSKSEVQPPLQKHESLYLSKTNET